MGTPLVDTSSSRNREAAVETLIDMDPNGAAYRISRAKNAALLSALRERPNRITDGALFEAAHALGKYEIALDSPEVLDLYGQESYRRSLKRLDSDKNANGDNSAVIDVQTGTACTDSTVDDELASTTKNEPGLREGWETRILRHHDKIIRAKNNANPTKTLGNASAVAASASGGMPFRPAASTHNAVPPPALISALRQIFGSASSHNMQDLLDSTDEISGALDGGSSEKLSDNTFPSLLYTVLNHNVFVGSSATSIPQSLPASTASDGSKSLNNARHERTSSGDSRKSSDTKRDSRMVLRHDGNGAEGRGSEEDDIVSAGRQKAHHSRDSSVATSVGGEETDDGRSINQRSSDTEYICVPDESPLLARAKEIPCVPSAANIESILGNTCRDMLHRSGTQNSRVHGLLIAVLSVITGCLFSDEELESMNFGGVADGPALSTATATSPRFLDSTNAADPFVPLLQVGALLSSFPTSGEVNEFALDKQLLRYFATASSLYEERIEIQKAKLFQSQTPLPPTNAASKVAQLLPLPLQENSDVEKEELTSANDVVSVQPERVTSDSEVRGSDSIEHQSGSGLLGTSEPGQLNHEDTSSKIDMVPASDAEEHTDRPTHDNSDVLAHIDDDDDENDDIEENESFFEEDPNAGDEFSESDHDDDTGSSHEESDDDDDDDDDEDNDGELEDEDQIENDDEDEELQRALTLSLIPAVEADSSDESHSDDGCSHHSEESHSEVSADSNVSDAITEAAAEREEALTMDISSSADLETNVTTSTPSKSTLGNLSTPKSEKSATLPPLPTPPPLSILSSHDRSLQIHPYGLVETEKFSFDRLTTSVFEPSALSNFGKLPASHVLVHLLLAVLEIMQDQCSSSEGSDNNRTPDMPPKVISNSFPKNGTDQSAEMKDIEDHHDNAKFLPDSTMASLLIVSLHLLGHLRDSALKTLKDAISSSDEDFNASVDFGDGGRIQTAHNSALDCDEADDPLIEKDNPAGAEGGAMSEAGSSKDNSESLGNKGLKRKAAAAVQIACLRSETELKLVKTWTNRVAFYSSCCILNLRCLRHLIRKSMEHAGGSSSLHKNSLIETEVDGKQNPALALFTIPVKARLSLLRLLSSFYSSSASKSFQSLELLMVHFSNHNDDSSLRPDSLQDQFFVSGLCNESLCLWGYALPLLFPDHQARVELLGNLLESLSSEPSMIVDSEYNVEPTNIGIKSCTWSDNELLCWKIDIVSKRLRVRDMLNCFVAAPTLESNNIEFGQISAEYNPQYAMKPAGTQDSLPILLALLSKTISERSHGVGSEKSNNLTKFYLALCHRITLVQILWNDLSISSIDANDHDISGGESSFISGSVGGIESSWVDRGSLQLKPNPESFYFDSTKCADSISVTSSSFSLPPTIANQRAVKVWGSVLSTTCFLPKSGMHRWAVRLDKCERGHVFVGVSTSRTNLKTYVGGDSFGWGLIGTQALWHDRTKIRGDYGATFRTGAVVVVTLDTNTGTLSFGLWKEGSSAQDATHSPRPSQSRIGSPRRVPLQGQAGGGPYIEDWGIAFEGLPLDVKLYPAVGLYQRDDRVTLCTVSQTLVSSGGSVSVPCGDLYFPSLGDTSDENHQLFVRSWNQTICSDGISFATEIFRKAIQHLSNCDSLLTTGNVLMTEILPCLASSICLIPSSIPTLSAKYAVELLPFVTRCAKVIDKFIQSKETSVGIDMRGGEWTIRTSSAAEGKRSSKSPETYIALIEQNVTQNTATEYTLYEGKSSTNNFSITGVSYGTRVYLVEGTSAYNSKNSSHDFFSEISSESHIIEARLSLDGASFEGVRYHVEDGSSERVTGFLQQSSSINTSGQFDFMKQLIQTECLLSLAVGHLSLILYSKTSMTNIDNYVGTKVRKISLDKLLSTSLILSRGVIDFDGSSVSHAVHSISERCKSKDGNSEIKDQWSNAVYDFTTTNKLMGNLTRMEDVVNILEQHISSSWAEQMGSLSRLCPDKYAAALKSIASAIFYHTYRSPAAMSEIVSQAIQYSKQILENGVREALTQAKAGIRFESICENHCSLLVLIAQFLFEFSSVPDINHSLNRLFNDIARISKSIHSEEDLDYIKQRMRVRNEQCTMQLVGLRSLYLLLQPDYELQGISVHVAVEAALISLPRLLCPFAMESSFELIGNNGSSNHCTSSGCTETIQSCIHSTIRNIYACVGSILESSVHEVTKSPTLGLLACYFTDVNLNSEIILNVLPSLRVLMDRCRERNPCSANKLLDIICKERNLRLLESSATILLLSCGQMSQFSSNSSLVDVLTENLFHEISETIALVAKDVMVTNELQGKEYVRSDWITCRSPPEDKTTLNKPADKDMGSLKSQGERVAILKLIVKSDAQSSDYLNQLLDILHVVINAQSFTESVNMRSGALLSTIGFIITLGEESRDSCPKMHRLPLQLKRRLLRLLRPIILATKADSSVIRQLFLMAGTYAHLTWESSGAVYCNDGILIVRSSVSLLRHLYMFSSSWRNLIHQLLKARGSDEFFIMHGVHAFLGGTPGSLSPGELVKILPEAVASSSSTVASSKTRHANALPGFHLNAMNSLGNGAEEIAVGLCRHDSLSGVISSIDSHHGTCEVIVLDPRSDTESTTGGTSVTTRAMHISAAKMAAADELPLYLDATNFPAIDVFSKLSDTFKNIPTIISSKSCVPGSELKLDTNAHELMVCCLGLRSMTVFFSEPKFLQKYIYDESGALRLVVAHALRIGSGQNSNTYGLNSLPSLETRFLHLLLMRLELKSRINVLDHTSPSKLKILFEDNQLITDVSTGSVSEGKCNHTSTIAEVEKSVGGESSSRSSVSREASSNERREEDRAGSLEGQNDDDDGVAAAHLREAAIVQMAELGLPRQWAELALSRVGGTNIEAAVHFCLERGGDMERLLVDETQRRVPSTFASGRRRGLGASRVNSSNLIRQLVEMGFPHHWCVEALSATRNNVDEALTWILMNGDRLTVDDEAVENGRDGEADDDDNDSEDDNDEKNDESHGNNDNDDEDDIIVKNVETDVTQPPSSVENSGWSGICPIRSVSGRPEVNPHTLEVIGSPSRETSSVGTKGVLVTAGKWYYEVEIKTAGCIQVGWADSSFTGHSLMDENDSCGNGPHTWTFDGWRRYRWHANATDWGCKWNKGDVVGVLVDMDSKRVSFTLNGKGEEIGMGTAFSDEGFRPSSGVYAYVCLSRREQVRLIIGGKGTEQFKYSPPDGYYGIGEAILDVVNERDLLIAEEKILDVEPYTPGMKKVILTDCSDGEHGHELFAWQHRYYGSDASVHLGSSRPSIFGLSRVIPKPLKSDSSTKSINSTVTDLSSRMSKIFLAANEHAASTNDDAESFNLPTSQLRDVYEKIEHEIESELEEVLTDLCVLYAQKLVMHVVISSSNQFAIQFFLPISLDNPWSEGAHLEASRRLWQIIEKCTSLKTTGWVGEAGAMALAAEALGLGISTGEKKSDSMPAGMCAASASDDQILLACGGVAQFLTAATSPAISDNDLTSPSWSFAACAENAIGRGVGGSLPFIKTSLQSAAALSTSFRAILLATVRRATRILSAVEYGADDEIILEEESDEHKRSNVEDTINAPDARLVSFLTGLLVSEPVSSRLSDCDNEALRCGLFEAWCVGLLSASCPWQMVSAFTAAGLLNICPQALAYTKSRTPIIARYLEGLESKVLRRSWAERAAVPVVSKYSQALIELLASVKRASRVVSPSSLSSYPQVDPTTKNESSPKCSNWECSEGWVLSNESWDVWTGTVELMEVDWQTPGRSCAHTLMDSGEGPPMLRENCTVLRGVDWDSGDDDGKEIYERDKLAEEKRKLAAESEERARSREQERKNDIHSGQHSAIEPDPTNPASEDDPAESFVSQNGAEDAEPGVAIDTNEVKAKRKKKKLALTKLPIGTVLSIEPWKGVPAMARRVRWHLTGKEGVYRYGGDGGCFDLLHVETNVKETRVKKKYPIPESLEQCASRCGFGARRLLSIILRLNKQSLENDLSTNDSTTCDGIMEWPDFGAGVRVECTFYSDGAISITEREVLFGSKDSGWEPRFGQPNFVSGQTTVISPTRNSNNCDNSLPVFDEYLGSNSFLVKQLRKKEDGGGSIRVTSEMHIRRARQSTGGQFTSSHLSPIYFDPDFHASSISVSQDLKSVTCNNSDGRGVAFGNVGFTKGIHYWEVKLEKANIGSVFIGVAEKPSCLESQPRLNRWLGWGFVNFRATYSSGAERVYGVHCHAGDTIGVMLDCDSGRLNYFIDGVKYGEHILNDLGCAYENISPMGFDADGCGSGGAAQGAPSAVDVGRNGRYHANSVVQPKALWPVIGLRHPGDQVTMSSKWMTSHGVYDTAVVKNILAVDEVLCAYEYSKQHIQLTPDPCGNRLSLPQWFIEESFHEYNRWESGRWLRSSTRGSGPCKLSSYGLDVVLDISPLSCAAACASLGLPVALLHGDRVEVKRSAGRILELQEEAEVLGVYQGRLFYRIVSQKSEGGSLTEGGGRSWFWDESEAVEGGLILIGEGSGRSIPLPKLRWFSPYCGGLKVIYADGAVVRSDLEIFEGVASLGTIACGTVIPSEQVIERRLNSCGITRYLIQFEPIGRGWISSRMRGGKEEQIVEILPVCADKETDSACEPNYMTPEDSAREWYKTFTRELDSSKGESGTHASNESMEIQSVQEFGELLRHGVIEGMADLESDSLIAFTYGRICDNLPFSSEGDCSFKTCAHVLRAAQPCKLLQHSSMIDPTVQEVANEALVHVLDKLPSTKALMARISMLRAFNRRARYALPWLPLRPSQECSAILGGLSGFGSSLERAGRSWDTESRNSWIQTPSISSRLRSAKKILFPRTTRYFLDSVMDATTSPTPLSHDEYELPREIRTIRVNRLKARRAMASEDNILKKKYSVFSQLQKDISGLSGATLRRGFVAKGHGGQKRAFKVKLIGEGVNDYSGPYREVFTDSMREITDLDSSGNSSLGVLQPTANNQSDVGDGRDLFIFSLPLDHNSNAAIGLVENTADMLSREEKELLNSFNSLTIKKDESYREIEEAVTYLGKLVGTACRHGIPLDLPLPFGLVWDRLTEERYNIPAVIKEIDILAFRTLVGDKKHHIASSTSNDVLATQRWLLNAFTEGLSSVVPVEIFSIFTGEQLRDIICGNPDIDVELLRRVAEYEGYTESDRVVTYFWDVLREMTTLERKHFLQFVWARNRLPLRASDFEAPFVIQKDTKDVKDNGDYPLPSASTCFFSLSLPNYPTKDELRKKLMYAIENVTTMESDFVTNDAEISEGWRGL